MRVAALYDVHGNLPALEAVLEEVDAGDIDLIIVGGDFVWGPFPRETLELLQSLGRKVSFMRGNADREVAQGHGDLANLDEVTEDITRWCAGELSSAQRDWLMALPEKLSYEVQGLGEILFCHGSPRSDEESLTMKTPESRLRAATAGVTQRFVICGHTHVQFDRRVDELRVINAGSVGMPYEGRIGARWALIGPDVDLRRTALDTSAACKAMRATSCPHVEEVFIEALTHPHDPGAVTALFEKQAQERFG